jgi:hypothetical protein
LFERCHVLSRSVWGRRAKEMSRSTGKRLLIASLLHIVCAVSGGAASRSDGGGGGSGR